jgi:hypothetical protein
MDPLVAQALAGQLVAGHQFAMQTVNLAFGDKAAKMDIAESFAAQGLANAQLPREVSGLQTAHYVPQGGGKAA